MLTFTLVHGIFTRPGAVGLAEDRRATMASPKKIPTALVFISLVLLGNPLRAPAQSYTSARVFPSGGSPGAVAIGDFNHDGNLDVVLQNSGTTTISMLLGNADGTFQPAANYSIGIVLLADIAAADFNGDGKLDLAVTDRDGTLSILLGNGDGTFQPAISAHSGSSQTGIVAADFNGDQRVDIALVRWP